MKAEHQSLDGAWAYSLHVAIALPAWFGDGAATGPLVGVGVDNGAEVEVIPEPPVVVALPLVPTQYA